ncbi:MAG: hypothetical protein Q8O79_03100 [Pseudomonadota bacterium]|nr:hypothetical protein [Pseudomonadota bacterium]
MSAILIEHVKASELPESWRARLAITRDAQVTVRIEEEPAAMDDTTSAFGMWRDRDDLADVASYARRLRAPRFERE